MKRIPLPDAVLRALTEADRAPGWNNRPRTIHRFDLAGDFGRGCTLYVVPFRRFAYRRQERMTADYWRAQGKPKGTAA
ncbi:MAG TPA: hypothetical protein VJN66_04515 [Rhodanobacteraceae bacterium]|nr:hypothetical protein [Rhodanobacteraceae bacterium]